VSPTRYPPVEQDYRKQKDLSEERAEDRFMIDAFANAVNRIERLLDQEATLLVRYEIGALRELNIKKSQGLLELSRAMQALHGVDRASWGFDPTALLAHLREKLEANRRMLDRHLKAAREVALVIARAIEEHESDGTYGAGAGRAGTQR
jgi:hypothetical protein